MGTKNDPGAFDCYANAAPDEPMFILLGRDPVASCVVEFWVLMRCAIDKHEPEKLEEARACATKMRMYVADLGAANPEKSVDLARAVDAMQALMDTRHAAIVRLEWLAREYNDVFQGALALRLREAISLLRR